MNNIFIRNYEFATNILANQDILINVYKLKTKEVALIQELCFKLNSYKPYIEFKLEEFKTYSRKSFYKTLINLENKNIFKVVSKPSNQNQKNYQIYFSKDFVKNLCEEEFTNLYSKWLRQQLYKEKQKCPKQYSKKNI